MADFNGRFRLRPWNCFNNLEAPSSAKRGHRPHPQFFSPKTSCLRYARCEHAGGTYVILDTIAAFSEGIIFQIKNLKPGMKIFYKLTDLDRMAIVAQSYRIDSQSRLLLYQIDITKKVHETY